MINFFLFPILILILNIIIKKFNYLPNYNGSRHQTFTNVSNIPLSGGIYILFLLSILFLSKINLIIFFVFIFLIGFASDKNFLTSPKKRLILQILTVVSFVYFFDLTIQNTRVEIIDKILESYYIKFIFTSFCILVLINGSNFIDGLNSLLLGYFTIILFIIFNLGLLNQLQINQVEIYFLFFALLLLVFCNFFNLFFLGDSGSYLIGLFLSYILISIYNDNLYSISPYFVIVLLWYPCFENLFSIIRKKISNISPTEADHNHLHQLIFILFQNITNIPKKYLNSIVSIIINIFNFTVLYVASLKYNSSIYQISVLIFCISTYLLLYILLKKKLG
tara:strand:+ start:360 stop:1364 length:1005 start_codon:yes stop_codon:yes gene_type:complete